MDCDVHICLPLTVIAGAEDGMGRGYAEVLARKGMNVLLVLVTHGDLEDFAQEISESNRFRFYN